MNTIETVSMSPMAAIALKSTLLILGCLVAIALLKKREPRWRVLLVRGTMLALPVLLLADFLAPVMVLKWQEKGAGALQMVEPVPVMSDAGISVGGADVGAEFIVIPPELSASEYSQLTMRSKIGIAVFSVWMAGLLCFFLRDVAAKRTVRKEADAAEESAADLESEWRSLCLEFGLESPPRLRVSDAERSPFLIGGRQALLVIPASLAGGDAKVQEMREHVFRHEAAHVAGGDLRWMALMRFCVRLLWFHPLVWCLDKLHLSACEEAADAEAARRGGSREYRGALARMALELLPVGSPATAFLRMPSVLKRLRAVGDHVSKQPPAGRASLSLIFALLLAGFVVGNLGMKKVAADDAGSDERIKAALAVKMGVIDFDDIRLEDAMNLLQIAVDSAVTGGGQFPLRLRLGDGVSADKKITLRLEGETFEDSVSHLALLAGGRHHVKGGDIVIDGDLLERSRMLKEIATGWEKPVDVTREVEKIEKALRTLILPSVAFNDTPLKDALQFLVMKAGELNGDEGRPFSIVFAEGVATDTPITLRLVNVPLQEALRYVTSLAQLKFSVEPHAVVIRKLSHPDGDLYTNVYKVFPTAFNTAKGRAEAKEVLEDAGIAFGEGAAAIFQPEGSQLIIRNTKSQMELVEVWIDAVRPPAPAAPSDQWFKAYLAIKHGEEAEKLGKLSEALGNYVDAESQLAELAENFPDFHKSIIEYRQKWLAAKIAFVKALLKIGAAKDEPGGMAERLKKVIIPAVEFDGTPLVNALAELEKLANESDQSKGKKISIHLLGPEDEAAGAEITLRLTNVPLLEAVRYTTALAQRVYLVTADGVVVAEGG